MESEMEKQEAKDLCEEYGWVWGLEQAGLTFEEIYNKD